MMISPEQYIDGLEWRYACKKFDPEARLEQPTWHALAESLRLLPWGGRFAVVGHLFSLQPGAPRFLSRQQRVLWDNNLLEQEGKPLLADGFPS